MYNGFSLKKITARDIAVLGLLTALATVSNMLTIPVLPNIFVISFNHTVNFLTGAVFGPIAGFISGFLGDTIGHLIAPKGAYSFYINLASGLSGLIPGLVFTIYHKCVKKKNALKFIAFTLISYILVSILVTSGLNTYALWDMYSRHSKTFWAYLFVRFPYQITVSLINAVISCMLAISLKKTKYFKGAFVTLEN